MGALLVLFVGLPIAGMSAQFLTAIEDRRRRYAIFIDGHPELDFWLLLGALLVGLLVTLSGMVMVVNPEETVD